MNMEIVRKEMIKPSSPTPHHLKDLKLSYLDQIAPPVYIPLIFFYEANEIHGQKYPYCQLLKSSLSMALTYYYPLAGRSTNKYSIDCNDAGALFVEAKVHADLLQVTENPDMDFMKQLLPLDPNSFGIGEEVILAVQMNKMSCGGTAIAVQMSHKLADGHSLVTFMNSWAAICRGGEEIGQPMFDFASIFPPIDLSSFRYKATTGITKEKIVTKRIVFDKEKLELLKYGSRVIIDHPTRVEVVSGLIWKHIMEVKKRKSGENNILVAVHAVNLRPRMNPSLSDHAFGNIWSHTVAWPMIEGENGYQSLIGKLRVAIKDINENYVKIMQNGDEYLHNILESFAESISKGEIETCNFSSWCRFPVYEVDYGWGKPVWVSTTTFPFKNVAILLSTKNGDGIEVWINMLEEDASVLDDTDYIFDSRGKYN